MEENEIRKIVRDRYGQIANRSSCCTSNSSTSCGCSDSGLDIGYSIEDLKDVPDGANLGLGCGNPTASAELKKGESVLDLGSGAGIDCFLAANKVGENGKVIGVDMTPPMIDTARKNAIIGDYKNVEFRLGEIENLPVADNSIDVIISNCVINLSPDKSRVFKEAYRVLKPGGRIIVSDIVLFGDLPDSLRNDPDAYAGCISGASKKDEYLNIIKESGFQGKEVIEENPVEIPAQVFDASKGEYVNIEDLPKEKLNFLNELKAASIKVKAYKPK